MTLPADNSPFWAVVPAAGAGRRFGADQPKQFVRIGEQSVLAHTLQRLAAVPGLAGIVLVVADAADPGDWSQLAVPLVAVRGGAERADSVMAGLHWLVAEQGPDCWALVHDAARPGVRVADVVTLMDYCAAHDQGAILALPARDTVKAADAGAAVLETLPRDSIWLAQTPQCFRAGRLLRALIQAAEQGLPVTDEASAMQAVGEPVQLIRGHWHNTKLTEPEDLPLIEWILSQHD